MRFQIYHPQPQAKCRLICFPSAGSDAVLYRDWGESLDPQIEVVAARYPGRGARLTEAPKETLQEIGEDLKEELFTLLDKPTYFFGHSLGAVLAFELASTLEQQGQVLQKLIVSGAAAPSESAKDREHFHQWSDQDFQNKLISLGGVPDVVADHPEILDFLTPMIRADVKAIETYHYQEHTPLTCPISVFFGEDDPVLASEDLSAWQDLSQTGVTFHQLPGKHFYFQENPQVFFEILRQEL